MQENFTVNTNPGNDISIGITSAVPAAAPAPEPPKQPSIYGEVPQIPTMEAVEGIRFDFNEGIRILFPHNGKRSFVFYNLSYT